MQPRRLPRHAQEDIAVHKINDRLDLVRVRVRNERELVNALDIDFLLARKLEVQFELLKKIKVPAWWVQCKQGGRASPQGRALVLTWTQTFPGDSTMS